MKKIGIIGGGFTGTMTAVQLIEQGVEPCEIILINEQETCNKGIAYHPYSDKHLLNVITSKMSAFADQPDHFLNWVMQRKDFWEKDRTLIANSFLPRRIYGEYLHDTWAEALRTAADRSIKVTMVHSLVVDLEVRENTISLQLEDEPVLEVDCCVIATGNHTPRNPRISNVSFYNSSNYFKNPWKIDAVKNTSSDLPVLIIGNGLTMVDVVLGLLEQGFKGGIWSISPNGFNILPHRHNGLKYEKLTQELQDNMRLYDLVKLVHQHIRAVREYGVSAEPVIDSLRLHTQRIWSNFTEEEKKQFMSRFRHLWGVARHRIPLHTHDKIQQLRIDGRLHIRAGRIMDFRENKSVITATYFDKKQNAVTELAVSRVINCTGPETDLLKLDGSFLKSCLTKGILKQDALKLGIAANTETFQVIDAQGRAHHHLFTAGASLKGELWESTAVHELRMQAQQLAVILAAKLKTKDVVAAEAI